MSDFQRYCGWSVVLHILFGFWVVGPTACGNDSGETDTETDKQNETENETETDSTGDVKGEGEEANTGGEQCPPTSREWILKDAGFVYDFAETPQGDVYALALEGLYALEKDEWIRIGDYPGQGEGGFIQSGNYGSLWAASRDEIYLAGGVEVYDDAGKFPIGTRSILSRFDGRQWSRISHGHRDLSSVWAAPNGEIFAVGSEGLVLMRELSGRWKTIHLDDEGTNLFSVSGSSEHDVWIVGIRSTTFQFGIDFTCKKQVVLHWNGSVLETVELPEEELDQENYRRFMPLEVLVYAEDEVVIRAYAEQCNSHEYCIEKGDVLLHKKGNEWTIEWLESDAGIRLDLVQSRSQDKKLYVFDFKSQRVLEKQGQAWVSFLDLQGPGTVTCAFVENENSVYVARLTRAPAQARVWIDHVDGNGWRTIVESNMPKKAWTRLWVDQAGNLHGTKENSPAVFVLVDGELKRFAVTDAWESVVLVSSLQGEAVAFGAAGSVSLWDGASWKNDLAHRKLAPIVAKGAKLESIWGNEDNIYMTAANGRTYHFDGSSWAMQAPQKTVSKLYGITGILEKSLRCVSGKYNGIGGVRCVLADGSISYLSFVPHADPAMSTVQVRVIVAAAKEIWSFDGSKWSLLSEIPEQFLPGSLGSSSWGAHYYECYEQQKDVDSERPRQGLCVQEGDDFTFSPMDKRHLLKVWASRTGDDVFVGGDIKGDGHIERISKRCQE